MRTPTCCCILSNFYFLISFGLSENQDHLLSSLAFFFCSKLLCWRFSCSSAYRLNHGQARGLVFSYSIWEERHHSYRLLLTTAFWREARQAGCPCQPPPQVSQPCSAEVGSGAGPSVFRRCWAGVVHQEPRWGTASACWQPQCRNSSGGRCGSGLASQFASLRRA